MSVVREVKPPAESFVRRCDSLGLSEEQLRALQDSVLSPAEAVDLEFVR